MPREKSMNKVEQRAQQKQAKPGREVPFALAVEHTGLPQKEHERTKENGKSFKHEREAKLVKLPKQAKQEHERTTEKGKMFKEAKLVKHRKQAKQAGPTNTNDQGPAETGIEARLASGAPRWLAPVENGINWIMR